MDWKGRKDPMHFEWNGTRPWLEQQKAVAGINAIGEKARRAQDGGSERLAPAQGGKVDVGGGLKGVPFGQKPSTDEVVSSVPAGIGRGGGGGSGGSRGPITINNTMTVHGGDKNPAEIANLAQRKITEDWNHRTHDLEPELT